jgi:hypothetical protein
MTDNINYLIRDLPYTLQEKVRYYYDYVKDRLFEIAIIEDRQKITKHLEKELELIFLLRLLYGYIVLGYRNYEDSLQFFESLEIDGFQIGTTHYSRNTPITQEWLNLAEDIETLVRENQIERYMHSTLSTDEIIRELITKYDEAGENYGKEENI